MDWTILVPRHRTVVDPTPPEDELVRVLPLEEYPPSGGWIDNIAEKLDHLVSLLTLADDLPRSSHGWIHLSALKRYDGPAVPGKQDPHTNTILHNRTFSLSRSGSAIPLDAAALYNMVAFDHRRRKHRLTLGEYQGPTKSQLVLALSSALPRQLLDRSSIPSPAQVRPLLSNPAYFIQHSRIRRLFLP